MSSAVNNLSLKVITSLVKTQVFGAVYLHYTVYVQYTKDGQHVTGMINEESGIMPLGTAFGWGEYLGRKLTTYTRPTNRNTPCNWDDRTQISSHARRCYSSIKIRKPPQISMAKSNYEKPKENLKCVFCLRFKVQFNLKRTRLMLWIFANE